MCLAKKLNASRPSEHPLVYKVVEGFNDWGGRGHDDFVPSEVAKQPLPGMRLHDPLHGRQPRPKFIAFDQGVGQICPRSRGYFRAVPSQNGNKYVTSSPPPIVELVSQGGKCQNF